MKKTLIIGTADVNSDEPGKLNLMADFPHVSEPGADYGMTLLEAQSEGWWNGSGPSIAVGRDHSGGLNDGKVLWVDAGALPLLVNAVTTEGVSGVGASITPPDHVTPYVGIVVAGLDSWQVGNSIHSHAEYLVLAAWATDPDDVPGQLEDWGLDDPFSQARWDELVAWLVARGASETALNNWWGAGGRTPREFGLKVRDLWS